MRFPRECVFQPRLYQRLKLQPARIEHPSGRCRGNPEKIRNGMPTITLSKTDVAGPLWPSFCCSCCHCWTAVINKCALVDVGERVFSQMSGWTSICGNCRATVRKCALNPAYSPLSFQVEVILRAASPKTEQNR